MSAEEGNTAVNDHPANPSGLPDIDLTDESLREAFQSLADDGGDTVDSEAIWRAASGEATPAERHAVIETMARNPAAAESWRIARALLDELGEGDPVAKDPGTPHEQSRILDPPRNRWRKTMLAAAASVVLVLGLGWWSSEDVWQSSAPIYREAPVSELTAEIADGVAMPRQAFVLRWSSAGEGAHYRLRVLTPELRPVVDIDDLEATEVHLEPESLADIPDGTRLLWQVEARLPDGRTVASATFFAEVR